jgi:ABC-type transport system involved in multi-copper enzyme maturation permease subunit
VTPALSRSLLDAELLKVRKRWLVYVLVCVMLLGAAVQVWLLGYANWVSERNEAEYGFGGGGLRSFVLPWGLVALLDSGQFWGSLLIGILTASAIATEYNWGTVRQAIVRGQTRAQYLTLKLAGIAALAGVTLSLALAAGVAMAVIATSVAGEAITLEAPGGPSFAELVLAVLRTGYAVVPYGLLAFALTVVGRSTTLGVAGIILYLITESILVAILGNFGGPAPTINAFLLGHNVAALLSANNIAGESDYYSFAFRETPDAAELPEPIVGALVVALYCAAFLAISYGIFQRRDLTSGAGAS